LSKSWKSGAFSILYTDFLPIPKKEEVVSHPERACAAGRTPPVIYEREEHNKLQLKLATSRDASLVRLPPSEAALCQHILCASLQTRPLQNNETARQKSVHGYVVNTLTVFCKGI
jgi:hypothetical protein